MTLLVTGATGFVMSVLARHWLEADPTARLVVLDASPLDAAVFAKVGIPSGMIFVRNENGSHNADEAMSLDDFAVGAQALLALVMDFPL